jgi:hypothetical protein
LRGRTLPRWDDEAGSNAALHSCGQREDRRAVDWGDRCQRRHIGRGRQPMGWRLRNGYRRRGHKPKAGAMRLLTTSVHARMVVACRATMRRLRSNKRRTVRGGGEGGRVEHACQAPGGKQRDEDKPKEAAPSQVAVMSVPSGHTSAKPEWNAGSLIWIKTTVHGEIGDA